MQPDTGVIHLRSSLPVSWNRIGLATHSFRLVLVCNLSKFAGPWSTKQGRLVDDRCTSLPWEKVSVNVALHKLVFKVVTFRFGETEGIAILTMIISRYKINIKEEPQFAGESFQARKDRILSPNHGITMRWVFVHFMPVDMILELTAQMNCHAAPSGCLWRLHCERVWHQGVIRSEFVDGWSIVPLPTRNRVVHSSCFEADFDLISTWFQFWFHSSVFKSVRNQLSDFIVWFRSATLVSLASLRTLNSRTARRCTRCVLTVRWPMINPQTWNFTRPSL